MMRVVRSSPDGVTRGVAVTCGASVSSSMVGNCDPRGGGCAATRARGLGAAATRGRGATGRDLRRELLVVVDLGHVDERAHGGGLVVEPSSPSAKSASP